MKIANSVAVDILAERPDHVVVTGDIVNIAARDEFPPAQNWLAQLGSPETVTFIPGNHDRYVELPYRDGLKYFENYMTGDMKVEPPQLHLGGIAAFPFVKLRRNVAIIGLSSAEPQALHRASGRLGELQLQALSVLLPELRGKGYCRVVLIHHPPLLSQATPRRGLNEALALTKVLQESGAELVLHGHNHERSLEYVFSASGPIPIYGAPCASLKPSKHHDGAGWTLFTIDRLKGTWNIEAEERNWDPLTGVTVEGKNYAVSRSS